MGGYSISPCPGASPHGKQRHKQPPHPNPAPPARFLWNFHLKGPFSFVSRGNQSWDPLHLRAALTECSTGGFSSFSCLGMAPEEPQELTEHSPLPSLLQHQPS